MVLDGMNFQEIQYNASMIVRQEYTDFTLRRTVVEQRAETKSSRIIGTIVAKEDEAIGLATLLKALETEP
jgi:hypothetical protein